MPPSQQNRLMSLTTPLGANVLLIERLLGTEALSELFHFYADVLCPADQATWTFDALLGQSVSVAVTLPNNKFRYISGIVNQITQAGQLADALSFVTYRLEIVPKAWLLTLNRQSQIFQQITVPNILKQVLASLDVTWSLEGAYEQRDYCVQYNESDWSFACRLMEEEGIYYYFKYSSSGHTLVVADTPQGHEPVPGATSVAFDPTEGGLQTDDRICTLRKSQAIRPGKVTLWDSCFELFGQNLEASKTTQPTCTAGSPHKLDLASNSSLEVYQFPGLYAQRYDGSTPDGEPRSADVQKIFKDNVRTAAIRMRQEATPALVVEGEGTARQLSAGCKFTLKGHPRSSGDYILTRVDHEIRQEGVYLSGGGTVSYACRYACIPFSLPYTPPMRTPRPRIDGPQTATVVGSSGDEIFTDRYGRIKVQFNWDRIGQKNAQSSCWIRVGTPWAGTQWGSIWIPRVGQEVIVAFEDGDPDRPIVVGSVYNATNMPPYTLPDNKTQSGILSRSTTQGDASTFNELRFEDKKGSEEIYFHAEKNFTRVVENDDTLTVGAEKKDKGDQTVTIFNNHALTVGSGEGNAADGSQTVKIYKNRTVTLAQGDDTLTVQTGKRTTTIKGDDSLTLQEGNRTVTIEKGNDTLSIQTGTRTTTIKGNETLTVQEGNRAVTISKGNDSLTVSSGNLTISASGGKISMEAAQGITLTVGGNSIEISTSGITIKGTQVAIQASASASLKGAMTQINGSGMLEMKGGIVTIN